MIRFLPLKYNLRNVGQRRLRSALTVLGIALVVFITLLMLAFSRGIRQSLTNTAGKDNVILLNVNAETDITRSRVDKPVLGIVQGNLAKYAKEEYGTPYISPEVHLGTFVTFEAESKEQHAGVVRGVTAAAFLVHPQVSIVGGGEPANGRKIMVGKLAATKLGVEEDRLRIGNILYFEETEWEIAGFFEAPGTAFESEIWCDVNDIITATKRSEYSMISITMRNMERDFPEIQEFCLERLDVELQAWRESKLYAEISNTMRPISIMVYTMMVLVTIGGVLGGMNTMYTAVLGRFSEFGALQVLGFGKFAIMAGLCVESVCIAGFGGILGAWAASFANGLSLKMPMAAVSFNIDLELMAFGVLLSLGIGFLGAIIPGIRSARMRLVDSLRAI